MKTVVVGISGGVDSSVAAWILKKQGYNVIGLFMINWHDTAGTIEGSCPWEDDLIFAKLIAKKLDIPLHTVDLSDSYKKKVVDYMFAEYEKGRTPNPDVLCNREVKFDLFVKEAIKLGADYVATGHYCRKNTEKNGNKKVYRLLQGKDPNKDQSYFLCQLSQNQLSNALFPVGELYKNEVRKIADENGLATAERKDSQGICFVGKVDLPLFLQQKLESKRGRIIELPENYSGFKRNGINKDINELNKDEIKALAEPYELIANSGINVGLHNGAHFFTIGQNKGLNIGGRPKSSFVIGTDIKSNILFTGMGKNHIGLYRKALKINRNEFHWVRDDLKMEEGEQMDCLVRIRYRQPLQKARVFMFDDGVYIVFLKQQRGISGGQFAAIHQDEELIASGVISG